MSLFLAAPYFLPRSLSHEHFTHRAEIEAKGEELSVLVNEPCVRVISP